MKLNDLDVIYEDNHLLVVNKPAGLLTQPSGTDQESLEALCKAWVKEKYQKPGNVFLEAVHRLDKPVSGIVLFSKTSKALSRLNLSMRNKLSKKIYLAQVEGIPHKKTDIVVNFLHHDDFKASIVTEHTPNAKLARLQYTLLTTKNNLSLLEVHLETGRYHQIRVQFAHMGCPIIGDRKYGSKVHLKDESIYLHHSKLIIPNPVSGELLTFEAKCPFL